MFSYLALQSYNYETMSDSALLALLILIVIAIVAYWKVYTKADQPGWAVIVPIYNYVVLLRIIGRPLWWIILLFIPLVNVVIVLVMLNDLAKSFGQSSRLPLLSLVLGIVVGFMIDPTIGAVTLLAVFMAALAFTDVEYQGPIAE